MERYWQLTQYSEIELVFSVAGREGGKLTDVDPFIVQLEVGQLDGPIGDGRALEDHSLLVGGQDGDTHDGVVDGHILLGAIAGFLPGDLGDPRVVDLDQVAMKDHIGPDEAGDRLVDEHLLSPEAYKKRGTEGLGCVVFLKGSPS